MNTWKDVDHDDIPGYLMDGLMSFLKKHGINTMDEFYEDLQTDSFEEEADMQFEDVIRATLAYKDNE